MDGYKQEAGSSHCKPRQQRRGWGRASGYESFSSWSDALAPSPCPWPTVRAGTQLPVTRQHAPTRRTWPGGQEHGKAPRSSYRPRKPGRSSRLSTGGRCVRGRFGVSYLLPGAAVTKHHKPETTGMRSLPVLEARSLKSRCVQGHAPSRGSGEGLPASSSFWGPQVSLGLWPHHSRL